MSAAECLRDAISERLTAAAEEILQVFIQTLSVYEKEIDCQRRLLDVILSPQIKLHRTELPQQHVCTEEKVCAEQKENCSGLDPEPPHIKNEQEELCTSEEAEQCLPKLETDIVLVTVESDCSEPEPEPKSQVEQVDDLIQSSTSSLERSLDSTDSALLPDQNERKAAISQDASSPAGGGAPNMDQQLLFHRRRFSDNNGRKRDTCATATDPKISTSTRCTKQQRRRKQKDPKRKKFSRKSSKACFQFNQSEALKPFQCHSCSKAFESFVRLRVHLRTHTSEKPFRCTLCEKQFGMKRYLKQHMITHSAEKPYRCSTCRKAFRRSEHVQVHMRVHTGEKPYTCNYCDKTFATNSPLLRHVRLWHTQDAAAARGDTFHYGGQISRV